MGSKLKVKNKQFERLGIKKTNEGSFEYIDKNNRTLKNNIVANPKEMERGIEEIIGITGDSKIGQ